MNASFKAECPHCFTTFNLKSRASAGKKVKCKNCGEAFMVKLIGDSAGAEFDDVEDADDADDYGSLPPSSAPLSPGNSTRSNRSRKPTKRKGGSSIPWKPIVIVLVVAAVGFGSWIGFQSLPSGGFSTMLDSPESVLDDYYQVKSDWIDAEARVKSNDDLPDLKRAGESNRKRIWELTKRMIQLGPISAEREAEVRKYEEELEARYKANSKDRSKEEDARIQSLNLDREQLHDARRVMTFILFSSSYAFPTPVPSADDPVEQFQAELDAQYRELAKLLVQIEDLSAAKSRLDEIQQMRDQFDQLRDHEHPSYSSVGSRYGQRRMMWTISIGEWKHHQNEWLTQDETVKKAFENLLYAVDNVDKNRSSVDQVMTFEEEQRSHMYKILGNTMKRYENAFGSFPGIDRDTKDHVGLSWRVHILPYMGGYNYHRFDLNSDWQSPQNQQLVDARPDFYKTPYVDTARQTSLHVFDGQGTPFGSGELVRFGDIRDGTFNTIMMFEGGRGTGEIWTKPGGILHDPQNPKQNLGQVDGDNYLAIMFDGSVKAIPNNIDDDVLNAMIRHRDLANRPRTVVKSEGGSPPKPERGNSPQPPTQVPTSHPQVLTSDQGSELHPGLKQLRDAIVKYHEQYQHFPVDSAGLSWRVHLLQHLDPELYSQFDLASDWNSPQNAKLSNQRPEIFKSRYDSDASSSGYNVFTEGPYSGKQAPRLKEITNGLSDTIMIIETRTPINRPWTQPGGMGLNPNLLRIDGNDYFALMFDGSIKRIPKPMGRADIVEFLKMATGREDIKSNR